MVGEVAIVGTELRFVDSSSSVQRYEGNVVQSNVGGSPRIIVSGSLQYVDENGDQRELPTATATSNTGLTTQQLAVKNDEIRWINGGGDEVRGFNDFSNHNDGSFSDFSDHDDTTHRDYYDHDDTHNDFGDHTDFSNHSDHNDDVRQPSYTDYSDHDDTGDHNDYFNNYSDHDNRDFDDFNDHNNADFDDFNDHTDAPKPV